MINKSNITENNFKTIIAEVNWLKEMITVRLNNHFDIDERKQIFPDPPLLEAGASNYSKWVLKNKLNEFDRLVVIVAIANIFYPEIFDKFLIKNKGLDKRFTEFSGKMDTDKSRFVATLGTINFIYCGVESSSIFDGQIVFERDYILNKISAIHFSNEKENDLKMSKVVYLNDEILKFLTIGQEFKPDYSSEFPAKLLKTDLKWADLVLNPIALDEVENINTWIKYREEISKDLALSKRINKGYKCLFYGPPGTGKTLTASLIGQRNNVEVYRIDLSQVVSKYVGETEKNLSRVFDMAENKNWILFFDEAESLFSKRTGVSDSKDRFANQQTAYLLQRMEEYTGMVILATNLKPNIDRAFSRRIQSIINFPVPSFLERKVLWTNSLSPLSNIDVDAINKLAKDYEISGGSIKNAIQFSWLYSKRNGGIIKYKHLVQGIKRELIKEGKSIESIENG